jgi:hypothetical protein
MFHLHSKLDRPLPLQSTIIRPQQITNEESSNWTERFDYTLHPVETQRVIARDPGADAKGPIGKTASPRKKPV